MPNPFKCLLAGLLAPLFVSAGELNLYSSGSTGADGPFAPEVINDVSGARLGGAVPPGSRLFVRLENSAKTYYVLVPLPPSGVFNFSTFNLPKDFVLAFDTRGTANPGVVILATGDIVIGGIVSVSAQATWLATSSSLGSLKDAQQIRSAIPGPGGFRGGVAGGFGANQFPLGPMDQDPGVTLPLTGGVGAYSFLDPSTGVNRSGGGGTLVLASSRRIVFEPGLSDSNGGYWHFDYFSGASFAWMDRPGFYGPAAPVGSAGSGSVALFCNETKGLLSRYHDRTIVCAFEQESFFANSMSPPWPVGVRGADMPLNPSARFVEFAGRPLTATGEPDRVVLDKSGDYTLVLETQNLPPGIVFGCTLRRLRPSDGAEVGKSTLNFPPTVTTAAGVCRAEVRVPITPGGTYITAMASKPIETVYSPLIDGEPLTEMVAQLDLQGGQSIHFKTASGRQVDAARAYSEALRQGKTRFPGFKG